MKPSGIGILAAASLALAAFLALPNLAAADETPHLRQGL